MAKTPVGTYLLHSNRPAWWPWELAWRPEIVTGPADDDRHQIQKFDPITARKIANFSMGWSLSEVKSWLIKGAGTALGGRKWSLWGGRLGEVCLIWNKEKTGRDHRKMVFMRGGRIYEVVVRWGSTVVDLVAKKGMWILCTLWVSLQVCTTYKSRCTLITKHLYVSLCENVRLPSVP